MVDDSEKIWIEFLKKHWQMFVVWVVAAILAFIGVIYVYLWHVAESQASGMVPETLGLWAMGHVITFLLYLILWEILIIGIPVIVFVAIIYFLWWKKLPDKEMKKYKDGKLFGKRSSAREGGEGISFLICIAFIIKIYLDGNWSEPFANWTFDYLVYSCLTALFWVAVVIGIPILIGGTLWMRHEMKK